LLPHGSPFFLLVTHFTLAKCKLLSKNQTLYLSNFLAWSAHTHMNWGVGSVIYKIRTSLKENAMKNSEFRCCSTFYSLISTVHIRSCIGPFKLLWTLFHINSKIFITYTCIQPWYRLTVYKRKSLRLSVKSYSWKQEPNINQLVISLLGWSVPLLSSKLWVHSTEREDDKSRNFLFQYCGMCKFHIFKYQLLIDTCTYGHKLAHCATKYIFYN